MPQHRKHLKKRNKIFPYIIIVLLIGLLVIECYLIIDNPIKSFDFSTKKSTEKPAAVIEAKPKQQKKEHVLTTDANQVENFKQEVLPSSDLSEQIDQDLQKKNFIGTALVIHDGNILLQKGYGYSNAQNETPNTYDSLYQIGSIQKGMTATLIAQQIQLGKLSLYDTIDKFYPSVPMSNQVTIQQLLTMTSGLQQGTKPTITMSDKDYISFAISNAVMGTFGKYKYEAINYYFLVGILQQVTGQQYKTLFYTTLIKRLPLSHTMFYSEFTSAPNRTYAYTEKNKQNYGTAIQDEPLVFEQEVGTGSIGMTVGDLYWYYLSWLNGKLVTPDTINYIWGPINNGSYIGGVYNFQNHFRSHGVENGFETMIDMSNDGQNAVILFTNQYPKNTTYQDLGTTIFKSLPNV